MDFRLLYTQKAIDDLAEVVSRVARDDPEAATRFGNSLLDHTELLTRFPRMGEVVKKRSGIPNCSIAQLWCITASMTANNRSKCSTYDTGHGSLRDQVSYRE